MNKDQIVKIIHECAILYENNYANRNIMVVFGSEATNMEYVVIQFLRNNYLHLTGIDVNDIKPAQFFDMCKKQKISTSDFKLRSDGTTTLKLEALPQIMTLMKRGGMVCFCDEKQGIKLYCDKLIGNTQVCIGLGLIKDYYYPKTLLMEDIRRRGTNCKRILLIFSKPINKKLYDKIEYTNKTIDPSDIICNSELSGLLSL
ncbi:MAG TPA: PBECR4 domain-containing protein [Clostridia bacterium]|nr:PBECR4 domain-containing protein [Clostridia bacterium]